MSFSKMNINYNVVEEPDHIYYDIDVVNGQPDQQIFPNLVFNDIRSNPILKNPSEYYMSVVRFSMQTPTLPTMICRASSIPNLLIQQGGNSNPNLALTNPNVLDYQISIAIGSDPTNLDTYSTFVSFIPETTGRPPQYPFSLSQQYDSNYYYLNTQSSFIKMVNNAFASLAQQINANYQYLNSAASQSLSNIPPVFMEYNPSGASTLLNVPFCFADNIVPQITSLFIDTNVQANYVIATTDIPHNFVISSSFYISGSSISATNGTWAVNSVLSPTSFTYIITGYPINTGVFINSNNLTVQLQMVEPLPVTIAVAGQIQLTSNWYNPNIVAGMFMTIQNATNANFNGTFYISASTGSTFTLIGNAVALPVGASSGSGFQFGYTYFYLYFNNSLWTLFSGYQSENNGQVLLSGENYRIKTAFTGTNVLDVPVSFSPIPSTTPVPINYYLQILPDFSTGALMCPISSLVFQTGLIPVQPPLISAPNLYGTNDSLLNSGNNANIGNTITDFQVGLTTGNEYKPNVSYIPSGEYRLFDLFGNNSFSSVQIAVYWRDFYSNNHPFTLATGASANIKIMFRKKSYGKTFDR